MKKDVLLLVAWFIILVACTNKRPPENHLSVDFETLEPGKLTDRETKTIWPGAQLLCGKKDFLFYKLGITAHPHFIAGENKNQFLKVRIPKGHFSSLTGAQWEIPLQASDEYFFSYRIRFSGAFDFVKGGKLPGLAGGTANTGGHVPDGYDGWSARLMFWENGKLSYYLYFPEQTGQWGERLFFRDEKGDTLQAERGVWHTVTQHIKMNTPGKADGLLQAWFDDKEVFYTDTILFRKDEKLKIDQILYSVFLGGGDASWASAKDEYICFDDFRVTIGDRRK